MAFADGICGWNLRMEITDGYVSHESMLLAYHVTSFYGGEVGAGRGRG